MSEDSGYRVDEQLLGDVESLLSFWPLVRDHPEIGPREAMRVLATWSHLQRFSPDLLDREIVGKLDDAVRGDATKLVERFSELTFMDDWVNDSEALDESWDCILDNDAADEADLSGICLFDVLDRFSLACHASQRLLPQGSEVPEGLNALIEEVAEGEDFLRDHPDIFLGAIEIASANLARYRPDLDQVDELLWETTLKHRVLEELLEERSAGLTQRLTQQEIDELLEVERSVEILPFLRRFREMEQSQRAAAATGLDRSRAEMRIHLATQRFPIEGDPTVEVAIVPEISNEGQWNGLDISLFGDRDRVGQYVEAVLSSESIKDPQVIALTSGVGTLFFGDDIGTDRLLQSGALRITLRDSVDREHLVRVR
jgi:hypothetical protein